MAGIHQGTFGIILALPIVLVHGYAEDATVWDSWKDWLAADNFTEVQTVTFSKNDQCGTVADHAAELNKIVNQNGTVNMVVHSKGGLDARSYIAQNPHKVANLIMIGTPNLGTAAAYTDFTSCAGSPALLDLQPDSAATKAPDRNDTSYWAIAGNYPVPCLIVVERAACFVVANDGFVEVQSALSNYTSLGTFPYNHNTLLTQRDVYERVKQVID